MGILMLPSSGENKLKIFEKFLVVLEVLLGSNKIPGSYIVVIGISSTLTLLVLVVLLGTSDTAGTSNIYLCV